MHPQVKKVMSHLLNSVGVTIESIIVQIPVTKHDGYSATFYCSDYREFSVSAETHGEISHEIDFLLSFQPNMIEPVWH